MNWWTQLVDWSKRWWGQLDPGDQGTWFGGLITAVTLGVTLIISAFTGLRQRSRSLKLRKAELSAARRAHAEKFSCWLSGRINSPAGALPVKPGELVVTLMNASEQPFTEAVVEVELKEDQGSASMRRFKISAVPPGTSWFAFDSNLKQPETVLPSIWFLDNGMRSWTRSSIGTLEETTKEQRLLSVEDAVHVWLHHGDPGGVLGLDDPNTQQPGLPLHAAFRG